MWEISLNVPGKEKRLLYLQCRGQRVVALDKTGALGTMASGGFRRPGQQFRTDLDRSGQSP